MKKYNLLLSLALIAFFLQTCREEESMNKGNVQFAFNASAFNNPGGRTEDSDESKFLFISITKSNGDPVYEYKELNLIKFGSDQYLSNPLALPPGNYIITSLVITNAARVSLYATPYEGYPAAELVEHPLPIAFSVTENEVTNLPVEVVSLAAYHEPGDFGYTSFQITVLPTQILKLSVFVPTENGLEPSGAQSYLLHEGDTVFNDYLQPGMNSIQLDMDVHVTDTYTLVLIEPSYKKYSRTFVLQDLWNELAGFKPMAVTLTPALTFVTVPDGTPGGDAFEFNKDVYFNGYLPATPANLVVDWGDGSIEAIPSDGGLPYHTYATQNSYFVSISGELESITSLSLFYGCPISEISLRHLPELRSFGIGASLTPATIDFSYNKKLEGANLTMGTFEYLDFSGNPLFKSINLSFNARFSSESLNQMIHLFLQRATEQNITRGDITMLAESPNDVTGPPSEAAKQKLRILRDTYDWEIYPDPDDY